MGKNQGLNALVVPTFEKITLPETNVAPENGWLEYDRFLFGMAYSQVQTVGFRERTKNIYPALSIAKATKQSKTEDLPFT